MEQILYIILGWLFGLLSPTLVSKISEKYKRNSLHQAISAELEDCKHRMAITNFLLSQRYGEIDKHYLKWLRPHLEE